MSAVATVLILCVAAPPALAVSGVAGATFPGQIVQEVTAVEQDEQAVMQTEQQSGARRLPTLRLAPFSQSPPVLGYPSSVRGWRTRHPFEVKQRSIRSVG